MNMFRHSAIFLVFILSLIAVNPEHGTKAQENPPPILKSSTEPRVISIDEIVDTIDAEIMLRHIDALAGEIGIRVAGSENERAAGDYIAYRFESFGYLVETSAFTLDNGRTSLNVWTELPGENPEVILIGAHFDSRHPAPGANDNASGVAVMLELARILSVVEPPYTCIFVAFGAEEIIDGNRDHHHYGSRHMAGDEDLRDRLLCMNCIDMVGVGSELWIDNTGAADDGWRSYLAECGNEMGLRIRTGETRPWSDHESFENVGVPVAWIHWRYDSEYHQATDVPDRIQQDLLVSTTGMMARAILGIEDRTHVPLRDISLTVLF